MDHQKGAKALGPGASTRRSYSFSASRSPSAAPGACRRRSGSPDVRSGIGAGLRSCRAGVAAFLRPGLGVAWCPRAHRTARYRRGAMGSPGPGGRRPPGRGRRRDVPVPLDAGLRAGRAAAFAARQVWVGVSAGSMVLTPRIGAYFVEWPSAPDDRTPGVADFSIFTIATRPSAWSGRRCHARHPLPEVLHRQQFPHFRVPFPRGAQDVHPLRPALREHLDQRGGLDS
jgi:hypothetical protein